MQEEAGAALKYAERDFDATLDIVDGLVRQDPDAARFHKMRAQVGAWSSLWAPARTCAPVSQGLLRSAQVLVDSKDFRGALQDYEEALRLTPGAPLTFRTRLLHWCPCLKELCEVQTRGLCCCESQ